MAYEAGRIGVAPGERVTAAERDIFERIAADAPLPAVLGSIIAGKGASAAIRSKMSRSAAVTRSPGATPIRPASYAITKELRDRCCQRRSEGSCRCASA